MVKPFPDKPSVLGIVYVSFSSIVLPTLFQKTRDIRTTPLLTPGDSFEKFVDGHFLVTSIM
jgi:hypothetical protein